MELNSKKIDFSNKTELVKLLDKFHDSTCNFKVIDEKKLKNSIVHVRDKKVSLYRCFLDFSSHDSAI